MNKEEKEQLEKKKMEFVEAYKLSKKKYENFTKVVENLLVQLLDQPGFKYNFQSRSKDVESLKEKLDRVSGLASNLKSYTEINDLSGCRVCFYLDSDRYRFREILWKEFTIHEDKETYTRDDYSDTKVIIKLSEDRLKLPEYKDYAGLKCEIQLTSILHNAWSELTHDVMYKDELSLKVSHPHIHDKLSSGYKSIMEKYITPAVEEFEYLNSELVKAERGKEFLQPSALEEVSNLDDNNLIHDWLAEAKTYIEESIYTEAFLKVLIRYLQHIYEKSKTNIVKNRESVYLRIEGYKSSDIANLILDIIEDFDIKYLFIKEVFNFLVKLSNSEDPSVGQKALKQIERLAEYNLTALKEVGYYAQEKIVDEISSWDSEKLTSNIKAILRFSESVASTEYEGTTMSDSKTLVFSFGALTPSVKLENIRDFSLGKLTSIYKSSTSFHIKSEILNSLLAFTYLPNRGEYTAELKALVEKSIKQFFKFLIEEYTELPLEFKNKIEEELPRLIEEFSIDEITTFAKKLKDDVEYEIFKVMYGYDYYYEKNIDIEVSDVKRIERLEQIIENINEKDCHIWQERILRFTNNFEANEAFDKYQTLRSFLSKFSKKHPECIKELLNSSDQQLKPFLPDILYGLSQSEDKQIGKELVEKYIADKSYIYEIMIFQSISADFDFSTLKQILDIAIQNNDGDTIRGILYILAEQYNSEKSDVLKGEFLRCVIELGKLKYVWTHRFWHKKYRILDDMSVKEYEIITSTLIAHKSVDYHDEQVLIALAEKSPKRVIKYFKARLEYHKNIKKEKSSSYYDAIPYRINDPLKGVLEKSKTEILDEISNWYKTNDYITLHEASALIKNILPPDYKDLLAWLNKKIEEGGKDNAIIVLKIFDAYNGASSLHSVMQLFIKKYSADPYYKRYKSHLFMILSKTGTVMGEKGLVEAYKSRKEQLKPWESINDPAIKEFVTGFKRNISQRIATEDKRSDMDIAYMNNKYGKPKD
jgi:ppGpp synthetase/RelA/SpoT-type nucleotidyltranferase